MSTLLSGVLMVKNEETTIIRTLESISGHIDSLIIYDTGSTDNTVELLQQFSVKHTIPLLLLKGEFIDFSTSRNRLLQFANNSSNIENHYFLLVDANEELIPINSLKSEINTNYNGFYITQEWENSTQQLSFQNIKIIKANSGWLYKYPVHECIYNSEQNSIELNITLYQNRTYTTSVNRYFIDKEVLEHSLTISPNEPRLLFYLAQTYKCIGDYQNAFDMYKKRTELLLQDEEHTISLYECGMLMKRIQTNWTFNCLPWFISSFEQSDRIEPLLEIIEHYLCTQKWHIAFSFLTIAFQLVIPTALFVNKNAYMWKRWHFGGICCFHIKQYQLGKDLCDKAIEQGLLLHINVDQDIQNLEMYNKYLLYI